MNEKEILEIFNAQQELNELIINNQKMILIMITALFLVNMVMWFCHGL